MATSRPRFRMTRDLALVALLGEPGSRDALEGLIEGLKARDSGLVQISYPFRAHIR